MASLLGIAAIVGGLLLLASAVEMNSRGVGVPHQLIRVLGGAWPIVIGVLLLGAATRILGERALLAWYAAAFILPVALLLMLASFGTGRGTSDADVARNLAEIERANPFRPGAQLTPVLPGRIFRDCADCPEMVEIEAGSFEMGSTRTQQEQPPHRVSIARPFALGRTEVTQGQWRAVMGGNPSYFKTCGDDCPVERVHWKEAQEFARKLSERTGQAYRLPSEAEWEYACRAGGSYTYCGSDHRDSVAQAADSEGRRTHRVGGMQANAFGLHDMSGNVKEWTEDCWHDNYQGAPADGSAWTRAESCNNHVARGGSWYNDARPASERWMAGDYWSSGKRVEREQGGFGLRLARTLP